MKSPKKGDAVIITGGLLKGAKGRILRQSPRTGNLSIELLEDRGAYVKTDVVHMMPYEVEAALCR